MAPIQMISGIIAASSPVGETTGLMSRSPNKKVSADGKFSLKPLDLLFIQLSFAIQKLGDICLATKDFG